MTNFTAKTFQDHQTAFRCLDPGLVQFCSYYVLENVMKEQHYINVQ